MIEVVWKKTVVANEEYNAWPNLLYYQGKYWLFFSAGEYHAAPVHRALFITSPDGENWEEPKLVAKDGNIGATGSYVFGDRVYCMLTKTWKLHRDVDPHSVAPPCQTLLTWTEDGETWSEPKPCYEQGWVVWRAKEHKGVLYAGFYISPYEIQVGTRACYASLRTGRHGRMCPPLPRGAMSAKRRSPF